VIGTFPILLSHSDTLFATQYYLKLTRSHDLTSFILDVQMLVFAGLEELVLCIVTLPHVFVPVGAVHEGPVTKVAVVGPGTGVDVHVVLIHLLLNETLVAHLADERHLRVLGVVLELVISHAAGLDALAAVRTSEKSVNGRHVFLQSERTAERLLANLALHVLVRVVRLHVEPV